MKNKPLKSQNTEINIDNCLSQWERMSISMGIRSQIALDQVGCPAYGDAERLSDQGLQISGRGISGTTKMSRPKR